MLKNLIKWISYVITLMSFILFGGSILGQPPEGWKRGIAYQVIPEAKITKVSWYIGKTEAGEMLIYEVGIKNISNKSWRFKLTIYTQGVDPIAGLFPWDKPALKPDQELVQRYPVFLKKMPEGFALVVSKVED